MRRVSVLASVLAVATGLVVGSVGSAQAAPPAGRWRVVASPNRFASNVLNGVALIPGRGGGAWAVGSTSPEYGPPRTRPLIERWNGYAWIRTVVWEPQRDTMLYDVSAVSGRSAFAVGDWVSEGGFWAAMAERWNGRVWSFERMPLVGDYDQYGVSSVVELSPTDAWAVGGTLINTETLGPALIEHWNGTRWSPVVAPTVPGQTDANLTSVRRIAGTHTLIAVGDVTVNGTHEPLVLRYDGTSWGVAASPTGTHAPTSLLGVATMAPTDSFWVVGAPSAGESSYAAEWTGSAWTPNTMPAGIPEATAVARVPSTQMLWATGATRSGTAALFYDGQTWTRVPTPTPGSRGGGLVDVTVAGLHNAWAVGAYTTPTGSKTLILRFK